MASRSCGDEVAYNQHGVPAVDHRGESELVNNTMIASRQPYIDGKTVAGEGQPLAVENPATEEIIAEVETCSVGQIESAIQAARTSFDSGEWANTPKRERCDAVARMGQYLRDHYDELAATLVAEAGASVNHLAVAQLGMPIDHIAQAIDIYESLPDEVHTDRSLDEVVKTSSVTSSTMVYEPVGVVTAISAYNFPVWISMWKVIPALLTGNSVILRPSPLTPLSALAFAEAADAVGLPPGVLNVVIEDGLEGGRLLTTHPAVDQVTFTGSTAVGRAIMGQAADTVKRLVLELGGKSVQLYLPDAVERAPMGAAMVMAAHAGQGCVLPTRMLVPEDEKASVVAQAAAVAGSLVVGDPSDPATHVGPLISEAQVQRCERYVQAAVDAGAVVATGGKRPPALERGHYFEPTVLDVADNSNPAAQDEIFGPVLAVIGYRDVDHAVQIANDTIFGLSSQVYGRDLPAATDVARRIRAGAVSVNGGAGGAFASSGGYRQSGLGRERGPEGIRSFQQVKHLSVANYQ